MTTVVEDMKKKTSTSTSVLKLGTITVEEFHLNKYRCVAEYGTIKNPKTSVVDIILDIQRKGQNPTSIDTQLLPAMITDLEGLTAFICYLWIFVYAKKETKRNEGTKYLYPFPLLLP